MRKSRRTCVTLQRWFVAVSVVVLAASGYSCGEDAPLEPEFVDLPPSSGEGSGTLRVVVEVEGSSGATPETEFFATVMDTTGAPVAARVEISGRFGTVVLSEEAPGTYSAVRPGYETGSYTLRVESDAGNVTGVTTLAPGIHAIVSPEVSEVVEANTALNVRWKRTTPSASCRLKTRDYDSDWIFGDPGTLWTPTIGNPPRSDQRVEVTRRNFQIPAGALINSLFSVGVCRSVEPVVAQ